MPWLDHIPWGAFQPVLVLGLALVTVLVMLEIIQLRGVVFSTHPLKPDFRRLDPAKGLKRLFTFRMLKETVKNIAKLLAYGTAAWLIGRAEVEAVSRHLTSAEGLARAMQNSAARLLFAFIAIAALFAVIDQIIVRHDFRNQMRMSRRELARETRDREGEPRFKQKHKQIHRAMRERSAGLGALPGSDMLVVNPSHFAVALRYDADAMDAPQVVAKGQNGYALLLKRKAAILGIPIMADARLARELHERCSVGNSIKADQYRNVATLYKRLAKYNSTNQGHE